MPYVTAISGLFRLNENPAQAIRMKSYMRNKFEFFGLPSPQRKDLQKEFLKEHGYPKPDELVSTIRELWAAPWRELHYFGMEILDRQLKNRGDEIIDFVEELILTKSWWDSVDYLSASHMGKLMKRFPEQIPGRNQKWLDSGNIWLQRTSLLFQLKYKKETDLDLIYHNIDFLKESHEFFIRKAIGWILREYSKTDPEEVSRYVDQTPLSTLSRMEALKVINRKEGRK